MTASDDSRDPLDLLAEDFLARYRNGEAITPEEFAAGHPDHAEALNELLPTLLLLEQAKRDRESSATGAARVVIPQLERLGEYRIVREVGRGGMGVVFEAEQESLQRRVALKVLPKASLLTGHQLERFQREARVAASLHHTHIVPVFDSGEADGYHYYAMQFIRGHGLDAVVAELRDRREGRPKDADSGVAIDALENVAARCRFAARVGAEVGVAEIIKHDRGSLITEIFEPSGVGGEVAAR